MRLLSATVRLLVSFALVAAQYFPPVPEGITTIQSKFEDGISITYKEVRGG